VKTLCACLFGFFFAASSCAQEVVTQQLGKFGSSDLSLKREEERGRELAYLYVSFQNADAPSDAIDIGGVMLADSAVAFLFANHLGEAVSHLGERKGRKEFEGRTYLLQAKAGDRRIVLLGKGPFKNKYVFLSETQATKLAEAVRRGAGSIRN
jgi:hypothetical protein